MKHVERNTYRPYMYKRHFTCETHKSKNEIFKTQTGSL